MTDSEDFRPTASLETLKLRSELLRWTREFFRSHGYWEVQTPVLSCDTGVDAWLEPFAVPVISETGHPTTAYLQTSPEFAMKRLLASGADAIFQIGPAFRRGEFGPLHNPEFTMIEWYRVGDTDHDQMSFTESYVAALLQEVLRASSQTDAETIDASIPRWTYEAAFARCGIEGIHTRPTDDLQRIAKEHGTISPDSLNQSDRDGWLNLLLAEIVEPHLAEMPAVFLHDYPASQAALAKIRNDDPPVAERFELYLHGLEICNGYHELTDPNELRHRIATQQQIRQQAGLPSLPSDSRLLSAMDAGLPDSAGVALGFDRLLMIALGKSSIQDVMAFPHDRA